MELALLCDLDVLLVIREKKTNRSDIYNRQPKENMNFFIRDTYTESYKNDDVSISINNSTTIFSQI